LNANKKKSRSAAAVTLQHVRFGSKTDICGAKRHVRFTLPAQLREDACDIPHAPMLDDLIVLHSENVTRSEAQ
jgi:hypothetical protein